jgi:XrtJ-associated TM-motif-TM protein
MQGASRPSEQKSFAGGPAGSKGSNGDDLKKTLLLFGFLFAVAMALPLRAQTGCDDSPEDPTIILALVGGAGALIAGLRTPCNRRK